MEANFNMGTQQGSFSSAFNGRIVSFQSDALNSPAEMISMDINGYGPSSSMPGIYIPSTPGFINHTNAMVTMRNPSGMVLHESAPRFAHVSGSPPYWSHQELDILNEGLLRFANETTMKKYTKIAAMLPQKTIRDVALRCQWMTNMESGKRRKLEEHHVAKRNKSIKIAERVVGSPSSVGIHKGTSDVLSSNPLVVHQTSPLCHLPYKVPSLDGEVQHLLNGNDELLRRIGENISAGEVEQNVGLFLQMENNITKIQASVSLAPSTFPGMKKEMPPFPVPVNKELLDQVLSYNRTGKYAALRNSQFQPALGYFGPSTG